MTVVMNVIMSDEVKAAIDKKSAADGISAEELIDTQLKYYIGCALYDSFPVNSPVNTPGLGINDRLEVYAEGVNNGVQAARDKANQILLNK